jgi:cytosine/adenosine deaminase-related metal-dependent hydrolase
MAREAKKNSAQVSAKSKPPIDPADSPKIALCGQIVTMDEGSTVIKNGVVYMDNGNIVALTPSGAAKPPGFENVSEIDTEGTIFPGFIELHNHLAYNILRLWNVPKKYGNRGQWQGSVDYHNLVSGPMMVLGKSPGVVPAIVRYVECKSMFGGVTTSQGIRLVSNAQTPSYFAGLVRNVENSGDPALPNAGALIADADTKDPSAFLADLKKKSCYLIHLSEGVDDSARRHFLALQFKPNTWAIAPALSGIHCNALTEDDFHVMASKGASMVWSPLSNFLLYGGTAKADAAKREGMRMGIGSDWSPSGSKNLLGELKVAKLTSAQMGGFLADRDIVALATRNAAEILKWDQAVGSIEKGKRADLTVWSGKHSDPYGTLIGAHESDLKLVVINGVPRYGDSTLMKKLGVGGETVKIGGHSRTLFLTQKTASEPVTKISLGDATTTLAESLKDLPNHASSRMSLSKTGAHLLARAGARDEGWVLALDEVASTGMDLRPHLPFDGELTMPMVKGATLSAVQLKSLKLDPLTVADDSDFLDTIQTEMNVPQFLKTGLKTLY